MTFRIFSADTKATAVDRFVAGEPTYRIAQDIGVGVNTLRGWIVAAGHPLRTQREAQEQRRARERGEAPVVPPPAVKPRRPVPEDLDGCEEADFRHTGLTWPAPASASGVTLTIDLIDDGTGSTRLVARAWVRRSCTEAGPGHPEAQLVLRGITSAHQASWDPAQTGDWSLGLLRMFATTEVPRGR